MGLLEAIVLGIVQGATEFLPVSSSGHLKLGEALLGLDEPQALFDIILHVGTLLSVVLFYRADILGILRDTLAGLARGFKASSLPAGLEPAGMRLGLLVVLGTIPTGLIGLVLDTWLNPDEGPSWFGAKAVCAMLILNGFILMANAYFERREARAPARPPRSGSLTLWNLTPAVVLVIGVFQGIAVLPGLSRSGLTITVALALMVQRLNAAKFSFLLSIPAILGALVLKFDAALFASAAQVTVFCVGALVAALVGYACLLLLTRLLERAQFHHFAWYCWAVGIVGWLWLR